MPHSPGGPYHRPARGIMKLRPDLTRWGKAVESFLAGYRIEHVVLALQVGLHGTATGPVQRTLSTLSTLDGACAA